MFVREASQTRPLTSDSRRFEPNENWFCPDCSALNAKLDDQQIHEPIPRLVSRCGDEMDKRTGIPTYKVLIIGPSGVGKTTLLRRISGKPLPTSYRPTCGLDSVTRSFWVSNKHKVNIELWDTPGDSRFQSLYPLHYSNTKGVLLVVGAGSDVTDAQTCYDKLDSCLPELPDVPVYLVVNQVDLSSTHPSSQQHITWDKFVRRNYLSESHYIDVVCGRGVYPLFSALATRIAEHRHPQLVYPHLTSSSVVKRSSIDSSEQKKQDNRKRTQQRRKKKMKSFSSLIHCIRKN